ncbi:wee1-like protein kinase isoform X1 [Rhododendron vialii]|uniref:wee1-like protein kinase isoform X1 n=1 Tax=Rhododendron vialii TaxID=182163 RepID=UPI00265FD4D5|nr:wee1-like protein kinase isoform X1 [Rhododendron vialii]
MKKKTPRSSEGRVKKRMKGSLTRVQQLGQLSFMPLQPQSSRFKTPLESQAQPREKSQIPLLSPLHIDADAVADDIDCILSQDFFCTPDYITPDGQYMSTSLDCNKENIPCPKSPEKIKTVKSKRQKQGKVNIYDGISSNSFTSNLYGHEKVEELAKKTFFGTDEIETEKTIEAEPQKSHSFVSHSAIALRCRVMPPPCIKNPYVKDTSETDVDPFDYQRSKCAGIFTASFGGDGLSRYRTDFHELEQIGNGYFSCVFKALKRIDGCFYAVKQSTRLLRQDTERRKALMEVQAFAALGSHENIVGYYSSWFENERLFIQMELCDHSLSISKSSKSSTEWEALEIMHQIAKALQFIHERGIAHLDVKPDNIYVKNGVYKLGDFGCATLLDRSLPIEEGDARYMPQEILNDEYDYLDKVDVFSLGAAIYELIRGSSLPESGPFFLNLRDGKLPLLPGHSVQFQNLLKAMIDPDPVRRPSAKELVEDPIFDRAKKTGKNQ